MRKDMRHVLIDRPRHASGAANRKERIKHKSIEHLEKLPKHGSKHQTEKVKSLSDHINPLRRYLEKQVGRPWDKVYSEISQNLDKRSTIQNHVFEHIFDYIEKDVTIGEDGKLYSTPKFYRGLHEIGPGEMYICPKSGLLKKTKGQPISWSKRYRLKQEKRPLAQMVSKDGRCFAKCSGIWYELEYVLYEIRQVWVWNEDAVVIDDYIGNRSCGYYQPKYFEINTDRLLGNYLAQIYPDFDGDAPIPKGVRSNNIAWTSRRQLNSNTLRKFGLKNDH